MSKTETAVKATYFSIIGNTLLALIKGITGYFGNSYAMIADAIESTADIFASFLVLFGIKYSNRPKTWMNFDRTPKFPSISSSS